MKLKLILLSALFSVLGAANIWAQDWTWVNEVPADGSGLSSDTEYYIYAEVDGLPNRFLNAQNGFDNQPTVTWRISGSFPGNTDGSSSYTLTSSAGTYFAMYDQSWACQVRTDATNKSGDDVKIASSYDSTRGTFSIARYKKCGTMFDLSKRNVEVTASGLTTKAQDKATSCWKFISKAQVDAYNAFKKGELNDYVRTDSWTNKSIYTVTENGDYVFWDRGANWGTQAIYTNNFDNSRKLDITVSNYVARFKYLDTNLYLKDAGGYNIYTDEANGTATNTAFYMQQQDGGYKFILLVDPYWSIGLGKDGDFDVLKLVPTENAPVWNFCDTKATMTVNATAKYGTFCAPFDVNVPEGVTASTATLNGTTIVLSEPLATIPANIPVILNAENGLATTPFYGNAKNGNPTEGVLIGVYADTPAPVGSYVLQMLDDKVAFYHVAEGKQPTVGANRCYLTAPGNNARAFYLGEEEETAVATIEALTTGTSEIYDINGIRTNRLQKGINVVKLANGKTQKVIVK